jgi:hypothetical protein
MEGHTAAGTGSPPLILLLVLAPILVSGTRPLGENPGFSAR